MVATWNLGWGGPRSAARPAIAEVIEGVDADVWVLTEMVLGTAPPGGYLVDAGDDWGYRVTNRRRRKVALWSRNPWRDSEHLDLPAPNGRLVAATTDTDLGPLRVVGVCIPWRDAHVRSGRADRGIWDEHRAFLAALGPFLARQPRPLVVAGDFNQRLPAVGQPADVHEALLDALGDLHVATAALQRDLLDHIAIGPDLMARSVDIWPGTLPDGQQLTDHWGSSVLLAPSW